MRAIVSLALGAVCLLASPANAVSSITAGAATLDATNPFSFTVDYAATSGTNLPGTFGQITFNFTGTNAQKTSYNFTYSLENTSIAPSASSRLGVFGFDVSGNFNGANTPAAPRFVVGLNGGNFNGLGNRDVCFFSGPNCNGSGNNGVEVSEAAVTGSFSLTFSGAQNLVVLDNFAARFQATGANENGSNSGGGLIVIPPPVPEPATWAMMLLGFGVAGSAMRNSRVQTRAMTA